MCNTKQKQKPEFNFQTVQTCQTNKKRKKNDEQRGREKTKRVVILEN